jgi:tRNA modification GTPase
MDDTIAALSTPLGPSALAVVRVTGARAVAVVARVWRAAVSLEQADVRRLVHGRIADADGETIDDVLAAVFRAPASYTGEDMVEITCHGGAFAAPRVLDALLSAGARAAAPGEFTQRAFLHGKMDLSQAEAVADVIHAETELAHRMAARQLDGALARALGAIVEPLRDLLAETEARVDFAEDVGWGVPPHVAEGIACADRALAALLENADWGVRAREGVRLALVGRPNVGKSSLFNALLGEDRAIVTPMPGTTRDVLAERWTIAGVPVRLTDTAGVRDASTRADDDARIEALGIERARREADTADVVVWVVDRSEPWADEDEALAASLPDRPGVIALNKSDLPSRLAWRDIVANDAWRSAPLVEVSARTGDGMLALRSGLAALVAGGFERAGARSNDGPSHDATASAHVTNRRHLDALERARTALARAHGACDPDAGGGPGELVAAEIRLALEAIGEVTGESAAPDLLERIFNRFCIGK